MAPKIIFLRLFRVPYLGGILAFIAGASCSAHSELIHCLRGLDRISEVPQTYTVQVYTRENRYLLPDHTDLSQVSGLYLMSPSGSCLLPLAPHGGSLQQPTSGILSVTDPWSLNTVYFGPFGVTAHPRFLVRYVLQEQLPGLCNTYHSLGSRCPVAASDLDCSTGVQAKVLNLSISRIESLLAHIIPTIERQMYLSAAQELGLVSNRRAGRPAERPQNLNLARLGSSHRLQLALRLAANTVEACRPISSQIVQILNDETRARNFEQLLDDTLRGLQNALHSSAQ